MRWTVDRVSRSCGHCGAVIAPDVPFALFTTRRLVRCQACAGVPVDAAEVDLERHRLETRQQATAEAAESQEVVTRRHARVRPSDEFAGLFDPKSRAAGDD
jgi:hypothetical protein